jgi:hypothetical protein
MTTENFMALSLGEEIHYYECWVCGQMVDKRQLDDVLFHETHQQCADIQSGEWIPQSDPTLLYWCCL